MLSVRCGVEFCLNSFDFNVSAKHVRIGIGGFAQIFLIVGLDGEEGGINPRQHARKAHAFISAQIYTHRHPLRRAIFYHLFDVFDILRRLNHIHSIAQKKENYPVRVLKKFPSS